MKLFKSLLVAPAALGLMAPVAANADSAFTSTTTLSGKAVFTVGAVADGGPSPAAGVGDDQEELYMQYAYELDVNTSFTGEDLLTAGIAAGNATGPLASMDSAEASTEALTVESLYYAFPVGDLSVTAGPKLDQDDVVAATISAYSDDFRLGANKYSLQGDLTGAGVAVAYSGDNGFVASASYISLEGSGNISTIGIGGDNGDDVSTLTLGYNGDGFGGGLVIASHDGDVGASATPAAPDGYDTFGGGIYYSPESIPATISVSYDTKDPDGTGADESDWFVGVDYEVGPGTLSVAYHETDVDNSSTADTSGFEVSYTYALNDSMTITPGYFTVEDTSANGQDDSGVVVETVFNF